MTGNELSFVDLLILACKAAGELARSIKVLNLLALHSKLTNVCVPL